MDLPERKEFNNGTVIVTIPKQAYPVEINQLELDVIESMAAVPIDFIPFRLVINLQFVDPSQPEKELLDFDPPIEVRIQYTKNDLDRATAVNRPLCLGFWDGEHWIRCTSRKHKFHLEPGATLEAGGWGVISVSNWGDPPHAWGT